MYHSGRKYNTRSIFNSESKLTLFPATVVLALAQGRAVNQGAKTAVFYVLTVTSKYCSSIFGGNDGGNKVRAGCVGEELDPPHPAG